MQTNTDFYLNQLKRLVGGKITSLARTGPPQGEIEQEFFGIVITLQNGKELTLTFLADDEGNGPGSFEIIERSKPMVSMPVTIKRTPRTLTVGGNTIQVEELDLCLPFARKPADLSEVGGSGCYRVFVTETREMSAIEFDAFAAQLLLSREWLSGKGGYAEDGRLCVEISALGRPILFVDPSGGDYARYVARIA